jgi:two-component system response regulator NreC
LDLISTLTPRELEVLRLIVAGYNNKQVAEKLAISRKTVETHRAHIMEKLEVHNAASLAALAFRSGIV